MRSRPLLAVAVAAALLAGCGDASRPASPARAPVVVDTDMGPDDMLALLYLAERRDVDLRAVTVSGTGLVRCPVGARHALALLAVAGRPDVPVACGPSDPLAGFNAFPPEWRDRADALFGLALPPARARPDQRGAVALLREAIAASPGRVTLLSLAPLTDTAALLRADPAVRERLSGLYAMGGAVGVPGNVGPGHEHAEYNVWVDPQAAAEVLRSRVPITLVGLDATRDTPATVFLEEALRRYHYATPAATAAWDVMIATRMYAGGQYLWDPLAAVALRDPRALEYRRMRLRVSAGGRVAPAAGGSPVRVAVGASRARFEAGLMSALVRGGAFRIPPATVGATLTCDEAGCAYRGPRAVPPGQDGAYDTVNRTRETMTHVIGHLPPGETLGRLRTALRRGGVPGWFARDAGGETPPHSRMTWLVSLTAGDEVLLAGGPDGTRVVARIAVRASGR